MRYTNRMDMITVLCFLPLLPLQWALYRFQKKKSTPFLHELCLAMFTLYMLVLLWITGITPISGFTGKLIAHPVNLIPGQGIGQVLQSGNGRGNIIRNIAGNVILFMPFGFFLPILSKRNGLFLTVAQGALCSIAIETLQLFLVRSTDIDDVILNTFGTLLGYVAFALFRHLFPRTCERISAAPGRRSTYFIMMLGAFVCMVCAGFVLMRHYNIRAY
ncbi:VanZ family protein [Eubacteriales bacterium OttesenSCG-928-K08]|nr:VanZ family protein [Eubacteriales bacterium OttesenSCG-928-K08]